MDETLTPLMRPLGVVVVGASGNAGKLGYGIARNLVASGYTGAIHFVSRTGGELFGRRVYAEMTEVPEPVDLAVLAVPASAMPDALRACGTRGIHAAILISSGFREAGSEGAAREGQCVAIAREHGMRLLGPNCIGVIDTHLPLDTSFLQPPMPEPGGVAFLSHSGAFCAAIIDWAHGEGFGFSQIVSLGNQADVTETDMLPAVATDPHTRAIVLYLEAVSDGRRFVEVAQEVTRRKPVIALKVGRTASGQKAAASHTGAMAGSDEAYDAAFMRAGVLRAAATEQMFDWARALASCPLPAGRAVAVLTNAGGPGVIAADALAAHGLTLAQLSGATRGKLAVSLPAAASVQNPVDMLASAAPGEYAACLALVLADPAVHAALVILPPPPMHKAEAMAEAIIPVIAGSGKPVVVALMGSELVARAREALECASVPTYPFPERAASALGALAVRAEMLVRPPRGETRDDVQLGKLPVSLKRLRPDEIVARCGILTAPVSLATSPEQTARVAERLGFPVVLKIASPDVVHKSDSGGVVLNVGSPAKARRGYTQVIKSVVQRHPEAVIEGVTVQKQLAAGQEVVIGAIRDATFGPLVMFGSGGVEIEGVHDVAFALAPLQLADALELMDRTWVGRRLDGFRNIPAADKAAAADALIRLSWLVMQRPEIREIEINPLRVMQRGAVALDVRLRL
jgi:acetate---CoA ligase (ADP-forming)